MYNAGFFTSDGVGCAAPDGSLTVEAHEWLAAVSDVSGLTWYLVHFGSTPVNEETIDYQKLLGEQRIWSILNQKKFSLYEIPIPLPDAEKASVSPFPIV